MEAAEGQAHTGGLQESHGWVLGEPAPGVQAAGDLWGWHVP